MTRQWEEDLGDLVERRSSALVGYAYVLTGSRADAEDLVQEALTRAFSRWRRGPGATRTGQVTVAVDTDGPRTSEGYVKQTILNLYLDGYRRRQRWLGLVHRVASPTEVRGPASGATVRADLVAALAALSPRQRSCVVLRYFEDLSVAEVAAALGVAEGTVKRQTFEALGRLRGVLGDDVLVLPEGGVRRRATADSTAGTTTRRTEEAR